MRWQQRVLCVALAASAVLCSLAPAARAGSPGGPSHAEAWLDGGDDKEYGRTFRAGELAEVTVIGTGEFDVYVYDEDGDLAASRVGAVRVGVVLWAPEYTSRFTIQVVNREDDFRILSVRTN